MNLEMALMLPSNFFRVPWDFDQFFPIRSLACLSSFLAMLVTSFHGIKKLLSVGAARSLRTTP